MEKYSLADILGHGVANQSHHITNKITRPIETIIIRRLKAVLIEADIRWEDAVVEGAAEGVVQVAGADAQAKAEAVDVDIIMTL